MFTIPAVTPQNLIKFPDRLVPQMRLKYYLPVSECVGFVFFFPFYDKWFSRFSVAFEVPQTLDTKRHLCVAGAVDQL